jgi:hypothetical protein
VDAGEGFERVPDGIVPLVGYRLWRVEPDSDEPVFFALTHSSADWFGATRGWVSARCPIGCDPDLTGDAAVHFAIPHVVPGERCSCGFYAMKELDPQLVVTASQPATFGMEGVLVLGRVELAGKVIEHDRGYRAERARIVELIPVRPEQRVVKAIARRAGVPVSSPVRVPREPIRDRLLRYRVAWTESKAAPSAERGGYSVVLLVLWVVYRVWLAVHSAGSP